MIFLLLQPGDMGVEKTKSLINERLRAYSQIEWWGPADELLSGDSGFAQELREWYRDFSRNWPGDASPIAAAEAQEFCWALRVYGV